LSEAAPRAARALIAVLLFNVLLGACTLHPAQTDPLESLLALIEQRLAISKDVARSKWNSGAPVEDLPRERAIVESIRKQAPDYGLDPTATAAFFQAQIEASKIVQRTRLAAWRAAALPQFANAPDLQRDIRPQLDRLTVDLLNALARAQTALQSPAAAARLKEHATNAARAAALAPLRRPDAN
jgi:chorismate mutase